MHLVKAGLVGGDLDRRRPVRQRAGDEPAGGRGVPPLAQEYVDDLAVRSTAPISYADANYILAGLVIEAVTGRPTARPRPRTR